MAKRRRMHRQSAGFTLVELLVVVAIIAVLMALLLPSLAAARIQAKATKCGANLRTIAMAINMFAADHEGRCVGHGYCLQGSSGFTSVGWDTILNLEYFKVPDLWPSPAKQSRFTTIQQSGGNFKYMASWALNCPMAIDFPSGFTYTTTIWYNQDANGGQGGASSADGAPWGVMADPAAAQRELDRIGVNWTFSPDPRCAVSTGYTLGARLSMFNSGHQIMLSEGQTGGGTGLLRPQGFTSMARDPNGFTYNNGLIAFRHPFNKSANFAFFDAHVERMGPKGDWKSAERLQLR